MNSHRFLRYRLSGSEGHCRVVNPHLDRLQIFLQQLTPDNSRILLLSISLSQLVVVAFFVVYWTSKVFRCQG